KNILYVNDDTGAISMAMDPSNPRVVYAAMWQMSRRHWTFSSGGPGSGIYKSMDITQRAFYYMTVYADPKDPNTIYLPNVGVYVSHNGGKKLTALHPPHGDNHVLWI